MRTSLVLIGLICIVSLAAGRASGQAELQPPISQLPSAEPFKIRPGSSFAASGSQQKSGSDQDTYHRGPGSTSADLSEALRIIRKNHINGGKTDETELTKSAISSMLRTLDPHSTYFDAAEFRNLLEEQRSEYSGIGATIASFTRGGVSETFVLATFPGSPANRAKLRFGDKIVAVDGESMTDKPSDLVRDKARGKSGSVVKLLIERAGTRVIETVDLRRDVVSQPSIPDAYILRQGIGYIDLSDGFNYTTSAELSAAIKQLHRQGMKSLILDLRQNTGGILEQAVKVAETFLPSGVTIVSQRGRFRIDNRVWKSASRSVENMPLVVLVNENSASASEIVAGALQDHDRALIVGETTFGKGLVQSVINLPFNTGLALTTAKYYTPSGRSIQRDYSNGNLYDYFGHGNGSAGPAQPRQEARTLTNRKVFGGGGITPDEAVPSTDLTQAQFDMLDPLFHFSREVVNGTLAGFEGHRVETVKYGKSRINSRSLPVTDQMIDSFMAYAAKGEFPKFDPRSAKNDREFIRLRLRYNAALAQYGSVTANQILIEDDAQTARAVDALPRARELADLAFKSRRRGK